jgi:hypothetical protein
VVSKIRKQLTVGNRFRRQLLRVTGSIFMAIGRTFSVFNEFLASVGAFGDALVAADGELLGPNPQATYDMDMALKSLKKLTQYDIETVVCYHGGVYKNNANKRLAELANG